MQKNKKGLSGGKKSGPPPKSGPNPQGLVTGGCPHREPGATEQQLNINERLVYIYYSSYRLRQRYYFLGADLKRSKVFKNRV